MGRESKRLPAPNPTPKSTAAAPRAHFTAQNRLCRRSMPLTPVAAAAVPRRTSFRSTSPHCVPAHRFYPALPNRRVTACWARWGPQSPPSPTPAMGCLPPTSIDCPGRSIPASPSPTPAGLCWAPAPFPAPRCRPVPQRAGSSRGRDYSWMGWRRLRREALALPK